jgi:hypothetical protein
MELRITFEDIEEDFQINDKFTQFTQFSEPNLEDIFGYRKELDRLLYLKEELEDLGVGTKKTFKRIQEKINNLNDCIYGW